MKLLPKFNYPQIKKNRNKIYFLKYLKADKYQFPLKQNKNEESRRFRYFNVQTDI